MSWRPSSGTDVAQLRAAVLQRCRTRFEACDVLEVDVPALNRYTATDPNIGSLRLNDDDGGDRFLQTSPESFMKRLLAGGYPDIFSICKAFRDGEAGALHQPEFTIIEWYRRGFDLDAIIGDTVCLIAGALDRPELETALVTDYGDAFENALGLNPLTAFVDELADAAGADSSLRDSVGNDRDAWLDLLLSTRVAKQFDPDALTVIRHYPASQAALARICPDNPSVAERFEVFYGNMELANGYVELTDAVEQRRRMVEDLDRRKLSNRPGVPVDEPLIGALEHGLPECAGVALGLERLLMIAAGRQDIRDIVTFAFDEDPRDD